MITIVPLMSAPGTCLISKPLGVALKIGWCLKEGGA